VSPLAVTPLAQSGADVGAAAGITLIFALVIVLATVTVVRRRPRRRRRR
jgi:hypothetical protein